MSVIITNDRHEQDGMHHGRFPAIHWGAICAGIVVGLAVQLVLAVLGLAAGLSAIDVRESGAGVENPGTWAAVWHAFSMLTAAFVGGYVAARMSGLLRKTDGLLHGFVAWGATTLLFAVLSMTAVGAFFGSIFYSAAAMSGTGMGAMSMSSPAASVSGPAETGRIEALVNNAIGRDAAGNPVFDLRPEHMAQFRALIADGDRSAATRYLTDTVGVSSDQAEAVTDQALIWSGSPQQASPAAQQQADRVVESASTVSWSVFVAVVLSLLLGVSGGALGAMNARRQPQVASSV